MFVIPGMSAFGESAERPTDGLGAGPATAATSTVPRVVVLISSTFDGSRTTLPRMAAKAKTNPKGQTPKSHNRRFCNPFILSRLGFNTSGWGG